MPVSRVFSRAVVAAIVVVGVGCSGKGADELPPPVDTGLPEPTPPTTPTVPAPMTQPIDDAPWFDADHLLQVSLELPTSEWDALRFQTRQILDLLRGECLAAPFESPFLWYEATATVDGEVLGEVGIRKKGLIGSMSDTKPSIKIDTDRFVSDQLFENGTERVTLNNERQDPSLLHACLAYHVFAEAGMPAPRCNFATVEVNGAPLGVYAHVEAVKKDFLRRHFASDDGDLYEGALSDFLDGWTGSFDLKTDDTDPTLAPVLALTEALEVDDDQLLDALDAVLDVDQFVTFWALESLIAHWDGYGGNTNNFYVYRSTETDRLVFLPWGADAVFEDVAAPAAFTAGRLTNRLWNHPDGRQAYVERMDELLATVWDEDALLAEVDRMEDLVLDAALDPTTVSLGTEVIREFVRTRRGVVEAELAVALPVGDLVRESPCVTPIGTVSSTFRTTWESLLLDPLSGAFPATIEGDQVPLLPLVGAVSGYSEGIPVVASVGVTGDFAELYQVLAVIYDWDLQPDVSYPLDLMVGAGYLIRVDLTVPYDEGEILGIIDGSVTFTSVSMVPGAPVEGTIEGDLLEGLF